MSTPAALPAFEEDTSVHLKDYTPPPFLADHVKLHIDLNEKDTGEADKDGAPIKHVLATVTNTTTFRRSDDPEANWEEDLVLNGGTKKNKEGQTLPYLNLQGLWVNGEPWYDYSIDYETGSLKIQGLPHGEGPFEITTKTLINASTNTNMSGLYTSDGIVCTQCESEGFRNMTFALDRPDVLSTYDVTIEADKARFPILLSNPGASFPDDTDLGNGRHSVNWRDDRRKPCYLFAMSALKGDMIQDTFTYPDGDEVELRIYTDPGRAHEAEHAMTSLKKAMQHEWDYWKHKYHGIRKDPATGKGKGLFMVLGVKGFNMGAMENNGLNIFNDTTLLGTKDNATDLRLYRIDSVVNHEYCHDETGNWRVPANWFQISWKEGLTVLRDKAYTRDVYDSVYQRFDDVAELRSDVFREDDDSNTHPIVLESYSGVSNAYDSLTYEKGAQVNRMLMTLVGEDAYRKAYRKFHDNPTPEVCDVPSYIRYIGEHSGMGISVNDKGENVQYIDQFIDSWMHQSGVPTLKVGWKYVSYDEDTRANKHRKESYPILQLTVEQVLKDGQKPYHMPLKMGLANPETGKDYFLVAPTGGRYRADGVLELREQKETFEFSIIPEKGQQPVKPIVSLNRDFSAYAKIAYEEGCTPSHADLAFQAQKDPNIFKRWDALQEIGVDLINAKLAGKPVDATALIDAYGRILTDDSISALHKSELLKLPSEDYIINLQQDGSVDPLAVREARDAIRSMVAKSLQPELKATYDALRAAAPTEWRFNVQEMGRRALMNLSLGYLCADKAPEMMALAEKQFNEADNYTDRSAAWGLLMNSPDKAQAQKTLDYVAQHYAQDELVMNNWLARQAGADDANVDTIKQLMSLPQFDITVPNKLRAVLGIGGFAGNVKAFHAPDGSGYRLMADMIAEVDSSNKEIAARMAKMAFGSITKYTPAIQDRMAEAIGSINQTLTKDTGEILGKLVADYEDAKAKRNERPTLQASPSGLEGTLGGGQSIQVA